MSREDVTASHISRQGTCKSKVWFDGSHNDLKNLGLTRLVPVLISGHLAAVQHVNQSLRLTTQVAEACESLSALSTQGAGACESLSTSHYPGGRSM